MLTRRGSAVIASLLLFFLITNLPADPVFSVASSILLIIFALEAVRFRISARLLRDMKITRYIDSDSTFVGGQFDIKLEAKHLGSRTASLVELRDLVPDGLEVVKGSNALFEEVKSSQKHSISYTVRATEIGRKIYEGAEVRIFDKLGLFTKKKELTCISSLKVYPKIPLVYLEIPARPNLTFRMVERGFSTRNPGREFTGIRDYIPGDDYKMIAWKAMAKSPSSNPMVKEHQQMKLFDVLVILLARPSMRDGQCGQRKIDRAVQAILTLASHTYKEGYPFSLIIPQASELSMASGSPSQIAKAVADMTYAEISDYQIIEFIKTRLTRKSLILFVTDLAYPNTINVQLLQSLRFEHNVHLILLHTPAFFDNLQDDQHEGERLAVEILKTIEDRYTDEFMLQCSKIGLRTYLCAPNEISTIMMEAFSAALRMSLP